MAYAKIRIENFGPIREGTFELRPLTILIGPNNSGKTYAATAAYAMVNGLAFDRQYRQHRTDEILFGRPPAASILSSTLTSGEPVPDEIRSQVHLRLKWVLHNTERGLYRRFLDAFAVDSLAALPATKGPLGPLQVSLVAPDSERSVFGVRAYQDDGEPFSNVDVEGMSRLRIRDANGAVPGPAYDGFPEDDIAKEVWGDTLEDLELPRGEGLYLPAARLGIIQGWTVLAASAIGSLRQQASRLRSELPPVAGVYADYLSGLVSLGGYGPRHEYPKHFAAAADLLESGIIQGQIVREATSLGVMRLLYRTKDFDLPLDRASSTVADMAPLAIALKEQLSQGDMLVIDEPESHLYPENEREVAKVLARVAGAGVRVLVPTHSSTFVHQISNVVRSGYLTNEERYGLGFTNDDRLAAEDVGLYQFKPTADGTVIEEIQYDPEFGFPEEGFYEVAESISDESYEIESRLPVTVQ